VRPSLGWICPCLILPCRPQRADQHPEVGGGSAGPAVLLDQPDGLSVSSETWTFVPALSDVKRNVLKAVVFIPLI